VGIPKQDDSTTVLARCTILKTSQNKEMQGGLTLFFKCTFEALTNDDGKITQGKNVDGC
jgi:hypothetical protein